LVSIGVIFACTVAIWWCSEKLSLGTSAIGDIYRIAPGVRGATLDPVASSFPELRTVVVALIAGHFDAGVGTIAGSALFNILVIPALASLAVGGLVVHASVVKRDGLFYVAVVLSFIGIFYLGETGSGGPAFRQLPRWAGIVSILLYIAYAVMLALQSRRARRAAADDAHAEQSADSEQERGADDSKSAAKGDAAPKLSIGAAMGRVLVGMAGVGVACHFLVEHGLRLFTSLGLSPAVAGVTVLAAATSLPDTLLSVFAARRGDGDGAIANAFASNSFDILICLGVPIVVVGDLQMNWDTGWPILTCLLGSSVFAVFFMITDWKITRTESALKLALYAAFCGAVFMGYL
jgi:cation:H+ antiporter